MKKNISSSKTKINPGKKPAAAILTKISKERIISAAKATRVRKEVMKLDLQYNELFKSLTNGKKLMDAAKETVKNKLDSMSEMDEMESLRLQMAMDRLSKLMSTLSNMLKKISDTASAITQNIK